MVKKQINPERGRPGFFLHREHVGVRLSRFPERLCQKKSAMEKNNQKNLCPSRQRICSQKYVSSRLQPNPRSVWINRNRVDKRVFLSDQYCEVNGQSGQLLVTHQPDLHQHTWTI